MRLIGNKTHGDLAEIGVTEFIQQFMSGYSCRHVGRELYRANHHEEDIVVTNDINKVDIPISLKAYGVGPLQLSTDKDSSMFDFLQRQMNGESDVSSDYNSQLVKDIINGHVFKEFKKINVMPLIYNEKNKKCNIMIFDSKKAKANVARIVYVDTGELFSKKDGKIIKSKGRMHPIYAFF